MVHQVTEPSPPVPVLARCRLARCRLASGCPMTPHSLLTFYALPQCRIHLGMHGRVPGLRAGKLMAGRLAWFWISRSVLFARRMVNETVSDSSVLRRKHSSTLHLAKFVGLEIIRSKMRNRSLWSLVEQYVAFQQSHPLQLLWYPRMRGRSQSPFVAPRNFLTSHKRLLSFVNISFSILQDVQSNRPL